MAIDRKKQIVESAIQIFSQFGYEKTTVSQIVKNAGVAQGTFYLYFQSKKDIFLQLIDHFLHMIYEKINAIQVSDMHTKGDIERQLLQLYKAIFIVYQEHGDLAKIFFREAAMIDEDFEQKLAFFYTLCSKYIQTNIEIGQQKGFFAEYDAEIIAYAIIGMAENVAYQFLIQEKRLNLDVLAENMAKFECYGLFRR